MNEDTQRYFRLHLILSKCTQNLCQLFKTKWQQLTKNSWKHDALSGQKFTKGIGKALYSKSKRIQQKVLKEGDANHWDLTLMGEVLKIHEFHDSALDPKLLNLISIRNKLAHNSSLKVSEPDFQRYFLEISDFLKFFHYKNEEIESLKTNDIFKEEKSKNAISEAMKLKDLGNQAFKNSDFLDAVDYYTKAIAIGGVSNSDMSIFYGNRATAHFNVYLSSKDETDSLQSLMDAKQSV